MHEASISKESLHKSGLRIKATGGDPFIELPFFSLPKDRYPIIKIDIMSPADTNLQLYYMTNASREYTETLSIRRFLRKGKNLLFVPVPSADLYGKLRLDPGEVPGDYYLNSIEVSAVPEKLRLE